MVAHVIFKKKNRHIRFLRNRLLMNFLTIQAQLQKKYLDKSIEVTGVISSVNDSLVSIDESVLCTMKEINKSAVIVGKNVSVKGR